MEDLYFETELKNREEQSVKKLLEDWRSKISFNNESISQETKKVYQYFEDILYEYFVRKHGQNYDCIRMAIKRFEDNLTDKKLSERYNKYKFSQEEIEYIKLVGISKVWRQIHSFDVSAQYAVIDILLRNLIIEQFGKESFQVFQDIMQKEIPSIPQYTSTISHYKELLSDRPYGEKIHNKLEEAINKKVMFLFNQRINCGGYALKVDQCIFPTYQENFVRSISAILEKFPFVRLLGDTELADDEYLVIYRAPKGKNTSHHFIRVDSDGTVREKDANKEPRIFESWEDLSNAKEAIFAVKKEHQMFEYDSGFTVFDNEIKLDFEGYFERAFKNKQNSFHYHNHEFLLKKTKDDEIVITTVDGDIVADAIVDESGCLVEIREGKEKYVENLEGEIKPIIINGKLINLEEFKTRKKEKIDFEGR